MSVDLEPVAALCQQHKIRRTSLVMLLQEVQNRYGYLPAEALKAAGRRLDVPLARLYCLATFYRSFSLTPRGKHEISMCTGTACHVRGAATVLAHLQRRLGVASGETTDDGQFMLLSVNCLGACALGPVMVVDGTYHGKMTVAKVDDVLAEVRAAEQESHE